MRMVFPLLVLLVLAVSSGCLAAKATNMAVCKKFELPTVSGSQGTTRQLLQGPTAPGKWKDAMFDAELTHTGATTCLMQS
jgi:hypothetical protein